jgi:mycothiol synthase
MVNSQKNDLENEMNAEIWNGFTLRPMTLEDAPAVVEVFNAHSRVLTGVDSDTLEGLLAEWQMPGFDITADTQLVLTEEGRVIAYADIWDTTEPHIHQNAMVIVHPDYWGVGIGTYLERWTEERARENIHRAPPEASVVLLQRVYSGNQAAIDILTQAGLEHWRGSYTMRIDLTDKPEEPQLPEGIVIRPIRPSEERAYFQAAQEAFRDHWGVVEQPFEQYYEQMHRFQTAYFYEPSLWFAAFQGDEIAGLALCRWGTPEDENLGWVSTLAVRRPWRRKGLGLALLLHSFGELYRRGKHGAGLGVDADNLTGALRLYERAGMRIDHAYYLYGKELRPGIVLTTLDLAESSE